MKFTLLLALAPVLLFGGDASLSYTPAPVHQLTVVGASPAASLEFFDGITPLGASVTDGAGSAVLNASSLTPGLHTIHIVERGSGMPVAAPLQIAIPAHASTRFGSAASYALGIHPAAMGANGSIAAAGEGTVSTIVSGAAPVVLPGVTKPVAVLVADFNGDGMNDIAVASATGTLSIYLNNGAGSYSKPVTYQTGGHAASLAFADFNNDGVPDIAVANETELTIAILPGRADGSFGTAVLINSEVAPRGMAAADLNGDGFADLAVTSYAGNTISILFGDGHGSLKPGGQIAANGPAQISAGDFNEEGSADLAVLSETSKILTVWINNGSGVFTAGASIANADSFATGQIVGSTHLDLLVQMGSNLHVLAGAGNGAFADEAALAVSGAAQLLAIGDFTGDGIADIAATDLSGVLSVFAAVPASAGPEAAAGISSASGNLTALSVRGQAWNAEALHTNTQIASSITLSSSASPSILSQAVTLTAGLNPPSATGKVTFYAGPTIIGIATVSSGQASMTTSLLPSGNLSLSARYSGDSSFNPSFSALLSQSVTPLPQNGMSSNGALAGGATPHGIVTGDFNNDGVTDIAVVDSAGSTIMVFLGNASGGFGAGTSIGANTSPFGIVAVDVNGDGNTDLVVTNNVAEITVMLGNGAGSFSIFGTYPTGNNPQGIAAADFNRDGIADIVVSNFSDGTLTVLLGQGDGSFPTTSTITVGSSPTSVAVADLNNDGLTDIVATNSGSATVSVIAGNGDGTFQNGVTFSAGTQPYWVVAADFNNDGLVDLAVANNLTAGANVSVLINKSTAPGTFPSRAAFTAGVSPHFVAIGDFNADGVPDLLVINKGTTAANGTYTVLTGSGTGTFISGGNLALGNAPWAAAVGDFNRDGRADAVIASSGNNNINFLQGVGLYPDLTVASAHTGNFTQGDAADNYTLTVSNTGSVGSTGTVTLTDVVPAGLTATAISGSGWTCTLAPLGCSRSDALPAGSNYPDVTLTVSVASNAPVSVTNSVTVSGGGEAATGNDTATDVTVVIQTTTVALTSSLNPSTSGVAVTFTAAINTTAATGSIAFYDGSTPLRSVTVVSGTAALTTSLLTAGSHPITARYSGDNQYGSSTSAALAQIVGTQLQNGFQAGVNLTVPVTSPSGVTIADFNGDGNADIAVSNSSSTSKVTIFLGNGDGTFHSPVAYTAGSNTAPYAVVAADFNGDGAVDLAVANNNGNTVSVLLNNGDGTFKASMNAAAGTHPQHLAVGDFNRDGIPDLAVADYTTGIISILLGNGDGTFQSLKTNTVGGNPRALVLRDFNGDGFTDIAVANFASNSVNLLLGKGDGTFQAGTTYSVGTNPQSITAGDFNGDGLVDLAVANNGSGNVTVLLGNGLGGFSVVAANPAAGTNPTGIVVNDFNGDGVLDLAVSDAGAGVSVLLGVGDGTFQAPLSYTAGTTPAALATDDFDKDGTSDLVVANGGSANITVLLGGLFYSDVTVAGSHIGNFTQGQTGAQYSMTVSNVGAYPTAGSVTATDTLPSGLTATAISGTGWVCTLSPLACKRSDSLAPSASYPAITITVNVSNTANVSVTNTLTVSGGHESNAGNDSATDPTTILQNTTLILAPSVPSWVYAEAVNLVATVSSSAATGTVSFYQGSTLLGTAPVSGGTASLAAPSLAPGTYTFNATYSGDSLYLGSSGTLTAIVGKATATVTLSGLAVTWNGSPQSPTVTTNPTGLNVSVTYNGSSTPPSNAGSYAVSATVNDPNYTGTANGTLVISAVKATVTLNIPNPTYDGNPHPATATTTPAGLDVSITYAGSGTAPTAAGTYQVHASVTTPNYTGSASGTLIIAAAPVTITLSGLNTTYNGSPQPVGVTTNPTGVSVSVSYNGLGTAPAGAGTYSVSATSGDTNYTGTATGTLVIAKAPVTFTLTNLAWTYDGTPKTATVSSSPSGVSFAATYNGKSVAPTTAGSYNLAVSSADGNYTGSASGTFTIAQATPVVTWAQPAALAFGLPLTAVQLNANSAVNGTFTYTPGAGTVLQPGTQPLNVIFTPTDAVDYSSATGATAITITQGTQTNVSIVTARVLSRDDNNNIVVVVTFANTGNATADNLTVTSVKIGTTAGAPVPFTVGTIPSQGTAQATFTVPGSAGVSGASGVFTLAGTFTGGNFSSASRVVLP